MTHRIYYRDSVIEWKEGDKAPPIGVQVIAQPDKQVGIKLVTSADYYIWKDGQWYAVDYAGLLIFMMQSGLVLFGEYIPDEEYYAIAKQAHEDGKAGWRHDERR